MGEKLPLIGRAVGGRILGPRPGKAIISFWQGIVEIILRAVVAALGLVALVCAIVVLSHDKSGDARKAGSGVVLVVALITMVVALITMVMETVLIVLRFLNVGFINYKVKWFLIADAISSAVLGLLFIAATSAAIYTAIKWEGSHSLTAAAIFSAFASIFLWVLGVWSVVFMIQKWNKHVVTYTLKDAILG